MAAQSLKKTCDLLIITTLLAMMFSAQISHSNNVNMCIRHCVSNQCLKEVKNATPIMCEDACKKLCTEQQQSGQERYLVPVPPGTSKFCRLFPKACGLFNL
ncbi:hypothetical protein AtNW77_Chr1g0024621 [Arabidopsis thaliana]|uniref:Plant thionin family protein n=1 Tax=Arabidopsis thaliana x Arabidopsis arenosa TaxID=1240361 RepID=A0A8T2GIK9_9BRAS|nr:hypothetical protein ISN45_At01g022210 [Arabidopsis thaliana x Arabidopsis arenosa]